MIARACSVSPPGRVRATWVSSSTWKATNVIGRCDHPDAVQRMLDVAWMFGRTAQDECVKPDPKNCPYHNADVGYHVLKEQSYQMFLKQTGDLLQFQRLTTQAWSWANLGDDVREWVECLTYQLHAHAFR